MKFFGDIAENPPMSRYDTFSHPPRQEVSGQLEDYALAKLMRRCENLIGHDDEPVMATGAPEAP